MLTCMQRRGHASARDEAAFLCLHSIIPLKVHLHAAEHGGAQSSGFWLFKIGNVI